MSENEPRLADDLDPGSPADGTTLTEALVEAANAGSGTEPTEEMETEGALGIVAIDIDKARQFLRECMTSTPRVGYGLGAKIRAGQVPGRDFQAVDCSGFVREALRRSTNLGNRFPDGSVVQHDWVRAQGFPRVDRADGQRRDNAVRIAFLRPQDTRSGIGHVVLLHNAATLESHGGVGPDSRPWSMEGWQSKAFVYLMSPA